MNIQNEAILRRCPADAFRLRHSVNQMASLATTRKMLPPAPDAVEHRRWPSVLIPTARTLLAPKADSPSRARRVAAWAGRAARLGSSATSMRPDRGTGAVALAVAAPDVITNVVFWAGGAANYDAVVTRWI